MNQKIVPNIWFNKNAKEAIDFYTAVFKDSKITHTEYYPTSKEDGLADFQVDLAGKELVIEFTLGTTAFAAINAGNEFACNPSISFMLNFDPRENSDASSELDTLWGKLSEGGKVLMEKGQYPFSENYGWVEDAYGVSWQLILGDGTGERRPFIMPSLLFTQGNVNRAEEAMKHYLSVFKDGKDGVVARYEERTGTAYKGSIMYADFTLADQWFTVMDTAVESTFSFNEAVSFSIACKNQAEIDYFWDRLSEQKEFEQCGWCKDRFGVSWQVVPANALELLKKPGAYARMMQMKKIVIADF
jgi:predicted 3-demethylubiquinone-9 3-methyltransferase (glyoxalase superfamily)